MGKETRHLKKAEMMFQAWQFISWLKRSRGEILGRLDWTGANRIKPLPCELIKDKGIV